jgi:hypothetical protein
VILDEAEALLDPVSDIEGFMLACLVDASTGMVLASRKDQDGISLPTTPRDLAWDLSRSVFGTTIEAYRLLARQLLSVAGWLRPAGGTSLRGPARRARPGRA